MTALAPTLEAFLTERLMAQRGASPNTVASYRDTFRLLLRFAAERKGKRPYELDFADLDASPHRCLPGVLGSGAGQQRAHPQQPPLGGPLAVRLRGALPP